MVQDARSQLVELLGANPELLAEVREMASGDTQVSPEDESRSTVFDGQNEAVPLQSKTGKSLKYEVSCFIDGDVEGPRALIVAYLPPEVATESIIVTVVAEGQGTAGRERSSKAS